MFQVRGIILSTIGVFFCIAAYGKYAISVAWHFLTVALQVAAGKKRSRRHLIASPVSHRSMSRPRHLLLFITAGLLLLFFSRQYNAVYLSTGADCELTPSKFPPVTFSSVSHRAVTSTNLTGVSSQLLLHWEAAGSPSSGSGSLKKGEKRRKTAQNPPC